jgi:hypothetical protein
VVLATLGKRDREAKAAHPTFAEAERRASRRMAISIAVRSVAIGAVVTAMLIVVATRLR